MYPSQSLMVQRKTQTDDGIGGLIENWADLDSVDGYIDLVTGTDLNTMQNAYTEQSTHVAVIPEYVPWITDDMRIVDENKRWYSITYVDDPVGVHHHLELYLNYGGDLNEQ